MIVVVRLGHRIVRDQRITSHCALVARAFGASKFIYSGDKDTALENSIRNVESRWGQAMEIEYSDNIMKTLRNYKESGYVLIHLTMYGIPVEERIQTLKSLDKMVIIIGGSRVPREIYTISDYNIAIGNQPHSEVAALGIMLHILGKRGEFKNPKLIIIPSENGKRVIRNDLKQ